MLEALPVCEIRTPGDAWYDYKHRYTAGLSEHLIPAQLPEAQYQRVQEIACKAHEGLRCRDLSRVDFVVPLTGEPIVLEVNTQEPPEFRFQSSWLMWRSEPFKGESDEVASDIG